MAAFLLKRPSRMMKTQGALVGGFLFHLTRYSVSTQKTYGRVIRRFMASAPPDLNQITPEHIEQFILSLKCGASTKNTYLSVLKAWFTWLEINHSIPNIARKVDRLPTLPPQQRVLSQQEYKAVIKATDGYMRDCIAFLGNSGLRATAFLSLKPENVGSQFLTVISKGKQCVVPTNQTIKDILIRNPRLTFIKSTNRVWLWRLCQKAAKLANIEPFSPHSLRHYFATELHRNKVPIETISKLMSHSCTMVTEKVYVHWSKDDLLGVTEVLTD